MDVVVSHLCLVSEEMATGLMFFENDPFREQWLVQSSPLGKPWGPVCSQKYY